MPSSVAELFFKGGVFMYPLLGLSILALIIIIERIFFFCIRNYRLGKSLSKIQQASFAHDLSGVNPIYHITKAYYNDTELGETHCVNVGTREANRQLNQHERGIKLLATIGAIAPLIGLLGTVWGMVKAFAQISSLGANVTPSDFAGGIWTGLLTTVAGLLVAIPAVTASRIFESKVDKLASDFNELFSHLKELKLPNK